tara:strand:- start:3 stop:1433 length:1431 start_codon:yes stop_codon:yes gene_type:complete
MKIYDYFLNSLKKNPNKIFIKTNKIFYTYQDIKKLIIRLENMKISGRYIAIISENSVYYFVLYLISSKYNKTFVPLDHHLGTNLLHDQIKKFKLNNIFCSTKISTQLKNKNKNINFNQFEKFTRIKNKKLKIIKEKNNNIFLLTFSSGSTSFPKPIAITEKVKIDRAKSNIKIFSVTKKDNIIISTPLHHTLAIRLMTIGIVLGSEISFLDNYKLSKFLSMIKKNKSRFTFFVSNQLEEISKNNKNIKYIKNLKCLVSSSSRLPTKTKKKLLKSFPKNIYEIYGLSEAAVVSNLDLKKDKRYLDSVGTPIPGVKVKIKKNIKEKIGEILIKSKFMCSGYLSGKKIIIINNKNYFRTGDLGYFKKNFLYFFGRKKNMIKINGVSIYLEDIENTLKNSKIIKDCVAKPLIDKDNINPRICLIFSGKKSILQIKTFCFKNLPLLQIPTYFIKTSVIPRNKMGKLNMKLIDKLIETKINY